jgi:hypothetical protein
MQYPDFTAAASQAWIADILSSVGGHTSFSSTFVHGGNELNF